MSFGQCPSPALYLVSMAREVENIVIGAGPGGYTAAIRLGQLGREVLVVDADRIGGTCLNYGCIPTKALLSATGILEKAREAARYGIHFPGEPEVNLDELRRWKDGVVTRLVKGVEYLLNKNGAQFVPGKARFLGPGRLLVTGKEEFEVKARNVIIATGSKPVELPNLPFDGERVITSKEALEIPFIPESLVVIGGGVIGLELACIYRKLGSKVTVVELMDTVLPGTDREVISVLMRSLTRKNIEVHTSSRALKAYEKADGFYVLVQKGDETIEVRADLVLVSVGRAPNTGDLGLEEVGVKTDKRGFIETDDMMRTGVDGIFAIGDVRGAPLLAHKAHKEGTIAAEVIAGIGSRWDYRGVPSAIFTEPEIAIIGESEEELRRRGIEYGVGKFPFRANGRALALNEVEGFAKLLVDGEKRLLGAHIIGPHASELLAELTLTYEEKLDVERIGRSIHPHPTLSEALMEAAENVYGKAIHILNG